MKVCRKKWILCFNTGLGGMVWFLCLLSFWVLVEASASLASIKVVAPPDMSWVTEKTIFLSGIISGKGVKTVLIQGARVISPKDSRIPVTAGTFGAIISLQQGENILNISSENQIVKLKLYYLPSIALKKGETAPTGFKRFYVHKNPALLPCKNCHNFRKGNFNFKKIVSTKANCTTGRCHFKVGKGEHVHGPVAAGICISCHNPHGSDTNKALLVASPEKGKLCFECHKDRKEEFTMRYVHDPAAQDCGLCHDPHSSDFKYQLLKPGGELCKLCHEEMNPEVYEDISKAKYSHKPVSQGRCTACHRPHSSKFKPLLRKNREDLCFICHKELAEYIEESKYRHGPVQAGDCTACHKVHGSEYSALLLRYFPPVFYVDYKEDYYDLCFGCHNRGVAKTKFTTVLTNFRDGDYNLHYFHVHRKKGRTCTACHDAHASSQPKHIRLEVPFGTWSYPIKFIKTPSGGTCIVGCHAPKTYDRGKPIGYLKK